TPPRRARIGSRCPWRSAPHEGPRPGDRSRHMRARNRPWHLRGGCTQSAAPAPSREWGAFSFGRRIGECVAQGGAGGDAKFGEGLLEVGGYRSRGEEEPGGDLFVGVACRGEQGDLALLRGERVRAGAGRG